jgi:hypothetical protein
MKITRLALGALTLAVVGVSAAPLQAQEGPASQEFLKPLRPAGDIVAPFFDGFYRNPDGTFTLSYGFMNRNTQEIVEIPVGENNFITPEQFNGAQPTYFPPVNYGGFGGRRERGAFAIIIPAEMADQDVVWTITHAGKTYSVPGRVGVAYELSHTPMAAGSLPPIVKFGQNATEESRGRQGITAPALNAKVGQPLTVSAWIKDRGERAPGRVNATWFKHQGPVGGNVTFTPATTRIDSGEGESTVTATFSAPGQYLLRVRGDNFGQSDSRPGNMCCWSNAFVPVTVTE